MDFDELKDKAKNLGDKIVDAAKDGADKAEDFAKDTGKKIGGTFDEGVDKVKKALDGDKDGKLDANDAKIAANKAKSALDADKDGDIDADDAKIAANKLKEQGKTAADKAKDALK
ncbi:hypothetical protein U6G28_05620 [Actinomycetaceae bacterium MB13-C1-2]|nr:hypothetical protein U6G28_05620 [Actinomycetaceae bacterium MB13-C1-2]